MALNWNISSVENFKETCYIIVSEDIPTMCIKAGDEILNPLTEALIFATMAVGLRGITEANAGEFYARLNLIEKLDGNRLVRAQGEDGKRPEGIAARITPEEIRAHIGLSVNVSDEARAKWLKRIIGNDLDRAAQRYETSATKAAA